MAEDDLHADVRPIVRRLVLVGALAYLAGAWLLVGGVLAPSVVPGPRVPRWVLSLAGAFLVLVGWLASSYGVRWYRRASWVVRRVAPTVMRVGVEISADSDGSRSLRALLSQARAGATGQPAETRPAARRTDRHPNEPRLALVGARRGIQTGPATRVTGRADLGPRSSPFPRG
jgi:hypothetical protein